MNLIVECVLILAITFLLFIIIIAGVCLYALHLILYDPIKKIEKKELKKKLKKEAKKKKNGRLVSRWKDGVLTWERI